MERIKHNIPYHEQIEIVPFGDLHLGSENCRLDKFRDLVKYISKTSHCYGIGMGDLFDCIYADDKRFDSSSVSAPLLADIRTMVEILRPIKSKLLGLLFGNHEDKLRKRGIGDPTHHLCEALGVPYCGFSCFFKLIISPTIHRPGLVIFCHHGYFSGRQRGSKVNNIERLAQHWVADVYLCGHSHDLFSTRSVRVGWEGDQKLLFGNTGSFVETASWGTCNYSERSGYPPQKLGVLKIKWYPKADKLYCTE